MTILLCVLAGIAVFALDLFLSWRWKPRIPKGANHYCGWCQAAFLSRDDTLKHVARCGQNPLNAAPEKTL